MDGAMSMRVRGAIAELLAGVADLSSITVYDFRCSAARRIGLGQNGLERAAAEVHEWIMEAIASRGRPGWSARQQAGRPRGPPGAIGHQGSIIGFRTRQE